MPKLSDAERIARRLGGLTGVEAAAEGTAAGGGMLSKMWQGLGRRTKIGVGMGGLLGFMGLAAAPGVIRGFKGAQEEARTLRGLIDNPELLREKLNVLLREGEMDEFIEAKNRERLAKLGMQSPQTLDTLRALMAGSRTPRLAEGEVRIGGTNNTELLDALLAKSTMFEEVS